MVFSLDGIQGNYIHPLITLWCFATPTFFSIYFLLLSLNFQSEKFIKLHLKITKLFIIFPITLFIISFSGSLYSILLIFLSLINSPPGYLEASFKIFISSPLWIFPTTVMLGFWTFLFRSINKRYHLLPKGLNKNKFITTNIIFSLLGPLGGHHFYLKNYKEGRFYLLTIGKFTIGLFIDAYQLALGKLLDNKGNLI
jgi:hypothetical protein